eukprot:scaffold4384_cov180-Ochromonas_danica.AAC.1
MTINDIANMLPVNEAKRWNSWDPSYILNPNSSGGGNTVSGSPSTISSSNSNETAASKLIESEENIHWFKYGENVIHTVKKKDYNIMKSIFLKQKLNTRALDDMEEELVLIFSFVNSKNTITSLPGPYHNVYDIPKNFKIKFDNIIFEEDVNWFPASSLNSRSAYPHKGILKGGLYQKGLPPSSHANMEKSLKIKEDKEIAPAGPPLRSSIDKTSSTSTGSGKYAPPSTSSAAASYTTSSASTTNNSNNKDNGGSDDLYKFVGMTAQPKDPSGSANVIGSSSGRYPTQPKDEKKSGSLVDIDVKPNPPQSASNVSSAASTMTAEERLRKLMADMQKQTFFPDHLKSGSSASAPGSSSNNSSTSGLSRTMPPPQQSNDPFYSSAASTAAPSLYDLANMHVAPSVATEQEAKDILATSYRSKNTNYLSEEALFKEYGNPPDVDSVPYSDPLAAFDVQGSGTNKTSGSSSAGNRPSSAAGGAVRARHDILSNTAPSRSAGTSRTTSSRQAWAAPPGPSAASSRGGGSPAGSTTSTPRYASPTVRSSAGNGNVSSNMSVSSVGSNGSNTYVGAGSTTSSKVYRHGSPAPNTRPNGSTGTGRPTGGTTNRSSLSSGGNAGAVAGNSSNMSVVSASVSSLGSLGSNNAPGGSGGRYTSPQVQRAPSSTTSRYASPTPAAAQTSSSSRRQSFSSNNSVGSTGSNTNGYPSPVVDSRRKTYGTSPMRSSYSNPTSSGYGSRPASPAPADSGGYGGTSSSLGGSKRFSTPTPQSAQHYDYDPSNGNRRPSTPNRTGWRF